MTLYDLLGKEISSQQPLQKQIFVSQEISDPGIKYLLFYKFKSTQLKRLIGLDHATCSQLTFRKSCQSTEFITFLGTPYIFCSISGVHAYDQAVKIQSSPPCSFCHTSVPQEEQSVLIVELHQRLFVLYGQIVSFVLPEESDSAACPFTFLSVLIKLWAPSLPFKKEILQTTSLSFLHLLFKLHFNHGNQNHFFFFQLLTIASVQLAPPATSQFTFQVSASLKFDSVYTLHNCSSDTSVTTEDSPNKT